MSEARRAGPTEPDDERWDERATLYRVVRVRLPDRPDVIDVDVGNEHHARGSQVAVELGGRRVVAQVIGGPRRVLRREPPAHALRAATDDDRRQEAALRKRELRLHQEARELATQLGLPVQIARVELSKSPARVTIFYTAEGRVDGRGFLRKMSPLAQARVELRQLGHRDAARFQGGVGPCGLQLCCNTFLRDFAPINIKTARDQGLPLAPERINGLCGRLLCCLVYEEAFYRQQRAAMPSPGKRVATPQGTGRVRDLDVLAGQVVVHLDGGGQVSLAASEVKLIAP